MGVIVVAGRGSIAGYRGLARPRGGRLTDEGVRPAQSIGMSKIVDYPADYLIDNRITFILSEMRGGGQEESGGVAAGFQIGNVNACPFRRDREGGDVPRGFLLTA